MTRKYKLKTQFSMHDYEGGVCNRYVFCYSAVADHYYQTIYSVPDENYGDSFYLLGRTMCAPRMNAAINAAIVKTKAKSWLRSTLLSASRICKHVQKDRRLGCEGLILTLPGADGQTL